MTGLVETFAAAGVSNSLVMPFTGMVELEVRGTFSGSLYFDRAAPGGLSWRVLAGPYTSAASTLVELRAGERVRVRASSIASGTAIARMLVQDSTPTGIVLPRRQVHTWSPCGATGVAVLGAGAGGTEFLAVGCPDDFYAVRVGFRNKTGSTYSVSKVKVCPSTTWNDYVNATGGATPVSLTFAHAGADVSDLVTAAGASTGAFTIGANATDTGTGVTDNLKWTWTDWTPCASVAADPTTNMRVLLVRSLVPSSQSVGYCNGSFQSGSNDFWTGTAAPPYPFQYFIGGYRTDIDKVTTWTNDIVRTSAHNNCIANGAIAGCVQFMTRRSGIVILNFGDSVDEGVTTTSSYDNYAMAAAAFMTTEKQHELAFSWANLAVGGMDSSEWFPRFRDGLAAINPSVVLIPTWTSNGPGYAANGATTATMNADLARAVQIRDLAKASGAVPVFLTPHGSNSTIMATHLADWLAQRDRVLALRSEGELVLDWQEVGFDQSGGAWTGYWKTGLTSDGNHCNADGHYLMARQQLVPFLRNSL